MNEQPETAEAKIERLTKWVEDLQSSMSVNCVYCGHRYGPRETYPVAMAEALRKHIAYCHHHPMARLLRSCKAADHAIGLLSTFRERLPNALQVTFAELQAQLQMDITNAEG